MKVPAKLMRKASTNQVPTDSEMPALSLTKEHQQRYLTALGWVEVPLGSLSKGKECQRISPLNMEKHNEWKGLCHETDLDSAQISS